jgi:hypothetical protein
LREDETLREKGEVVEDHRFADRPGTTPLGKAAGKVRRYTLLTKELRRAIGDRDMLAALRTRADRLRVAALDRHVDKLLSDLLGSHLTALKAALKNYKSEWSRPVDQRWVEEAEQSVRHVKALDAERRLAFPAAAAPVAGGPLMGPLAAASRPAVATATGGPPMPAPTAGAGVRPPFSQLGAVFPVSNSLGYCESRPRGVGCGRAGGQRGYAT